MPKGKEKIEEHHHDALITSMTKKAESIGNRLLEEDPCIIYRVPRGIRQGETDAYEPQIMSIGPYHQDKHRAMEEHKWHHLKAILSRDHDHSLADYIKEIQPLEGRARSCYSEHIDLGSDEFVEMMVLDGCFIVEFLIKVHQNLPMEVDPIYGTPWMMPLICQDILLLENQLPFFILQRLFDIVPQSNTCSLVDLALHLFHYIVPTRKEAIHHPSKKVHHLLHLFHSHHKPTPPETRLIQMDDDSDHHSTSSNSYAPRRLIPSATDIWAAGIRFSHSYADSFLNITYEEGHEIRIPKLTISDTTANTLFRNMIAFEQCYPKAAGTYFSSYTLFMSCILETTQDATLLKQNGIMEDWLCSDDEVVHMFRRMCKGVVIDFDDTYLSGMIKDVAKVCKTYWSRYMVKLKRDYFSSPWAMIQFQNAILVLVFVVVQIVVTF